MAVSREEKNARRREAYRANADVILARKRARTAECPHCQLMFCSAWYLKKHMLRHERAWAKKKESPQDLVCVVAGGSLPVPC